MRSLIGSHDILLVTLDTLRYDVAAELAATGRTPHLSRVLPGGRWERRHSPASFTYAAHHAFFAGFLPTPDSPGDHERLYAAAFPGSTTSGPDTWVFDAPDLPTALAGAGYHTLCLGGVGFFNQRGALGRVLPGLFAEAHWEPEFGVTAPDCLGAQLRRLEASLGALPAGQPLFTFLNVAALHQPNRHYLPGAATDSRDSHAAALEYVDSRIDRLFQLVSGRDRPVFTIVCADHGTAYGEDGHTGHRVGHEVVWTVPYAQFVLTPGA
ncbi:STM4013/SEN3800 family hydrolase [Actinoplanes teichomyceticus]|uniref:Sulfatase-like protein n=1 Tax=Actinoplanes teichomyceticus TaxID=1867 RepID=A0A561WKZ9_ACTTI|nr:STM4013/SEN3800 family hydrolase [Actinoplanes teichomyceticus]TWG24510.1 sulfatase-like protein [Actinoplanes teichomyceticus]GIF16806.1 membrane protein [Actinoplanes teichomyceticus]